MSDLVTSYIFYLTAYRVIAFFVGAFAVYLGYRLFVRGVWPDAAGGTEIDAEIAGHRFTVKNAAPGTVIGLFGVAIITVMVVGNPPQAKFEEIVGVTSKSGSESETQASALSPFVGTSTRLELRGEEAAAIAQHQTIATLNAKGVKAQEAGEFDIAAKHYQHALDLLAAPLNNLAWLRFKRGDAEHALPLAALSVQLSPNSASFLHTLAEVQLRLGLINEARVHIRKAATLDPDAYAGMLTRFEEAQ